jgi:serine/threonine-protein kinase
MTAQEDRGPLSTEISISETEVDPQASGRCDSRTHDPNQSEAEITTDERLSIGERLSGRYRIERELGAGGMGVVYLVSDEQVAGEIFAVKVLKEGPVAEALSLLREEVRKTRKLSHPNIVDVHSVNVDSARLYVLMEYLEGKSLNALLDEEFARGMAFSHAWPIIEDVAAALGYAHDHNVIHSDLKPANIFLTHSGKTKLLDFGIARVSRGPLLQQRSRPLALTPAYASCEMLEGEEADARDDIYSFACVIYEMLCGKRVFGELTALEAREAGAQVPPLGVLSREQNAALAQALASERKERTASVEELLAGLAASGQSARSETDTPLQVRQKTIAVLPFQDLSEKKDQEYFADGIAEEILNLMSRVPGLRVIARTSSFRFRGKSDDLGSIATQLGAGFVVEGSVRQSGSRVRVSARLIDTTDGVQRWSNSYERDISDVLTVQEEIAVNLVSALQVEVAPEVITTLRAPPASTEAYDAFRRGMHAVYRFDKAGYQQAIGHFRRALELDPSFVQPAEALAVTFDMLTESQVLPPSQGWEEARAAANLALQLDPESSGGHMILGNIHTYYDWDRAAAAREINTALQLAPNNAFGLMLAAKERLVVGDWRESLRLLNLAISIDPFESFFFVMRGVLFQRTGRTSDAKRDFRRALEISAAFPRVHSRIAEVLLAEGSPEAALAELQQETRAFSLKGLALVNHALKRHGESDAALARLVSVRASIAPMSIAQVYAFRGQIDEAFEWLERAIAQKEVTTGHIKGDPLLSPLVADPRYARCLRKMNLPE